ncbi:hypothetical protein Dimus_030899, partial [Dionaea muscipula]
MKLVKIDRYRGLILFENEEGFRRALSLEGAWWDCKGVAMTPRSDELVIKPRREMRLRCYDVPLHVRSPCTFTSIGMQLGVVLMLEFSPCENGCLDDGRILIIAEVMAPYSCVFTLKVDGKDFVCRVAEKYPLSTEWMKDRSNASGSSGSGHFKKVCWFHGSSMESPQVAGAAMDDSKTKLGFPGTFDVTPHLGWTA